jgi:pentatricopeptide repeat protein
MQSWAVRAHRHALLALHHASCRRLATSRMTSSSAVNASVQSMSSLIPIDSCSTHRLYTTLYRHALNDRLSSQFSDSSRCLLQPHVQPQQLRSGSVSTSVAMQHRSMMTHAPESDIDANTTKHTGVDTVSGSDVDTDLDRLFEDATPHAESGSTQQSHGNIGYDADTEKKRKIRKPKILYAAKPGELHDVDLGERMAAEDREMIKQALLEEKFQAEEDQRAIEEKQMYLVEEFEKRAKDKSARGSSLKSFLDGAGSNELVESASFAFVDRKQSLRAVALPATDSDTGPSVLSAGSSSAASSSSSPLPAAEIQQLSLGKGLPTGRSVLPIPQSDVDSDSNGVGGDALVNSAAADDSVHIPSLNLANQAKERHIARVQRAVAAADLDPAVKAMALANPKLGYAIQKAKFKAEEKAKDDALIQPRHKIRKEREKALAEWDGTAIHARRLGLDVTYEKKVLDEWAATSEMEIRQHMEQLLNPNPEYKEQKQAIEEGRSSFEIQFEHILREQRRSLLARGTANPTPQARFFFESLEARSKSQSPYVPLDPDMPRSGRRLMMSPTTKLEKEMSRWDSRRVLRDHLIRAATIAAERYGEERLPEPLRKLLIRSRELNADNEVAHSIEADRKPGDERKEHDAYIEDKLLAHAQKEIEDLGLEPIPNRGTNSQGASTADAATTDQVSHSNADQQAVLANQDTRDPTAMDMYRSNLNKADEVMNLVLPADSSSEVVRRIAAEDFSSEIDLPTLSPDAPEIALELHERLRDSLRRKPDDEVVELCEYVVNLPVELPRRAGLDSDPETDDIDENWMAEDAKDLVHSAILSCIRAKDKARALRIFHVLEKSQCGLSPASYTLALRAHSRLGDIEDAFSMLEVAEHDFKPIPAWYHEVISGCLRRRLLERCELTFEQMQAKGVQPDNEMYCLMIRISGERCVPERAIKLYRDLEFQGLFPDINVFNELIRACSRRTHYVSRAVQFYDDMIGRNIVPNARTLCNMLYMCTRTGDVATANVLLKAFDINRVPKTREAFSLMVRTLATSQQWPTILVEDKPLSRSRRIELAMESMDALHRLGVEVDNLFVANVLSVITRACHVRTAEHFVSEFLSNKKGSHKLTEPAYNSMILMYGKVKKAEKAVEWLRKKQAAGFKVSFYDYRAALRACGHQYRSDLSEPLMKEMEEAGFVIDEWLRNFAVGRSPIKQYYSDVEDGPVPAMVATDDDGWQSSVPQSELEFNSDDMDDMNTPLPSHAKAVRRKWAL